MDIKHLAIKLACLNSKDFDWFLNQLPQSKQTEILPLVQEVKSLGLSENLHLRDQVLSASKDDQLSVPHLVQLEENKLDQQVLISDSVDEFWKHCLICHLGKSEFKQDVLKSHYRVGGFAHVELPQALLNSLKHHAGKSNVNTLEVA